MNACHVERSETSTHFVIGAAMKKSFFHIHAALHPYGTKVFLFICTPKTQNFYVLSQNFYLLSNPVKLLSVILHPKCHFF